MADPQAALLSQLRNIQTRTGRPLAQLLQAVRDADGGTHSARRQWLMAQFQLGYGDANTLAHFVDKPLPEALAEPGAGAAGSVPVEAAVAAAAPDPLAVWYAGPKATLLPLHEQVLALVRAFGPSEEAPKKTYLSLRRKRQFATVGPATRSLLEIGFNARGLLPEHPRLKPLPEGSMCTHSLRLGQAEEVDALLNGWLRIAYDAAG